MLNMLPAIGKDPFYCTAHSKANTIDGDVNEQLCEAPLCACLTDVTPALCWRGTYESMKCDIEKASEG